MTMTPDAILIRDMALALFDGSDLFKFRSNVPIELEPDDQLPALTIAVVEERLTADGDLTVAQPRFVAALALAAVVRVQGNDRDDAQARLEKRSKEVLTAILRSASFVASVDGFSDIVVQPRFWKDGERFYAQDEARLTIQYRVAFPPIVEDDFDLVQIKTRLLGSDPKAPELTTTIQPA